MHAKLRVGLNESVLESLAARYRTYLEERRYASQTRHIYLSCVTHFARWATSIGDSPTRIDEAAGSLMIVQIVAPQRQPALVGSSTKQSKSTEHK